MSSEVNSYRVVGYEQYGEPGEVLAVHTLPSPTPPGVGEVLIRVVVRPVHPGDLNGVVGPGGGAPNGLQVPGLEGVGAVEAVGDGVDNVSVGDRVAFFPASKAWGEYVTAPAGSVFPVPEALTDELASLVLVNTVTMRELARELDDVWGGEPGGYVQTAAGSSVGGLLTAAAVRHGYTLVNLVRSAEGAAALAKKFPSVPAFSTSDPEWPARVRGALGGPASVVLDAVGGPEVGALLDLLGERGTLIAYGWFAAPVMSLPSAPLVYRHLRLRGASLTSWFPRTDEEKRADVQFAFDLAIEQPELFPIAGVYGFDALEAAVTHARRPGKVGTVLLSTPLQ